MSGGSYEYVCYKLQNECEGRMYDEELNQMVLDFVKLLHDLEWWQSCDIGEEDYRKTVKAFKQKWFKGDRNSRLEQIIDEKCETLKQELKQML